MGRRCDIGFDIFREGNADPGGKPRSARGRSSRPPRSWRCTTHTHLHAPRVPRRRRAEVASPSPGSHPTCISRIDRAGVPVEPQFSVGAGATSTRRRLTLELPVTTPPAQVPQIVSAGLALSEYTRNDTYSATEPRRRSLWLELDQPPADPNDTYFIRLLGYAPDPLLSDDRIETFVPPEESPLGDRPGAGARDHPGDDRR